MSWKNEDKFVIIDIGSNTIRSVLYDEDGTLSKKENIVFPSYILSDTKDGELTNHGIETLISDIKKVKEYFLPCKNFYAFATSAMRDVKNFSEVFQKIKSETGVEIDLISGETEALCDFLAIKNVSCENEGIAVDLGGGSGQVIVYQDAEIIESTSKPIGVKRVKNLFLKEIFPDSDEILKISQYIEENLSEIKGRCDTLWFMGGTLKAIDSGVKKLFKCDEITVDILDELYGFIKENSEAAQKMFYKRYEVMPTGIIVTKAICQCLGAGKIRVTEQGVRDGYVKLKILAK